MDDAMFPESNAAQREAAQLCSLVCPVQAECLQAALDNDERYGVWGGTTERERQRIRVAAKKAAGEAEQQT